MQMIATQQNQTKWKQTNDDIYKHKFKQIIMNKVIKSLGKNPNTKHQ